MFSDLPKSEQKVLLKYPNYSNDYVRQHFEELDSLAIKGILKKEISTSSCHQLIQSLSSEKAF